MNVRPMKNILSLITVFFFLTPLKAQTIEGKVYDAHSKEALQGVFIYLNRTSVFTSSDSNGNFRLVVVDRIRTPLVFNLLGFEPLIIENPFEYPEKSFFLQEKTVTLQETVIVADRFSRDQKIKAFKEQFLGDGRAGKSCAILNEEDLVIKYDPVENRLTAFSINPLIIKNDYLAYLVTFDLHRFSIQYTRYTLSKPYIKQLSFTGTSSFVDENPFNLKIAKRRDEKYFQSRQYFWKNLVANTLEKANLKIYNGHKQTEPGRHFIITDTLHHSLLCIKPDANLNRIRNNVIDTTAFGIITVLYNNRLSSDIVFMTGQVSVDTFGNIDAVDKIRFTGTMGKQRIGDMLPGNYAPIRPLPLRQ